MLALGFVVFLLFELVLISLPPYLFFGVLAFGKGLWEKGKSAAAVGLAVTLLFVVWQIEGSGGDFLEGLGNCVGYSRYEMSMGLFVIVHVVSAAAVFMWLLGKRVAELEADIRRTP